MFVKFWMAQRLTREINSLEKQLMYKQIELSNKQKYASRLGGSVNLSIANLAGLSSDLLPRASLFANYAEQASSMSAMQNLNMMQMFGRIPITGNQLTDMQIRTSAYIQFKQEALKALKQQEVDVMNEQEKNIQLEVNAITQQLTAKKAQLESYKKSALEDAQKAAPNFGS